MPTPRSAIAMLALASLLVCRTAAGEPAPEGGSAPGAGQAAGAEPTAATPACSDERAVEVAKVVQARYDAIRDLEAEFEQSSRSAVLAGASLADVESTRGKVVFAKPGKMRWSYEEPEPSLVLSDGKTLWIYDVGAKQASKLPVDNGYLAGAALQFLLGEGDLVGTFQISALRCADDIVEIDLLPRAPASYERLGLTARTSDGLILETTISDLLGSRTTIRFARMRFDLSPPDATFSFEPPEGVEVIDLGVQ